MSIQLFFFPFLFSGDFCSVDACVVCIVSGGCNQSSSDAFFCSLLVVVSIHRRCHEWSQVLFLFSFLTHTIYVISGMWGFMHRHDFSYSWSICWSFSLVHFKNGPEYLMRRTVQVFILFRRYLPYCLASRSFLVLLRYSFFSFISACLMVSASNIPKHLYVSISLTVLVFFLIW